MTPEETAAVAALHERAVAAWPEVARVPLDRFAAELARRLGALDRVGELHTDIYLAIAAHDGDAVAARACDEIAGRETTFAAYRLRASQTVADDVHSELRRLLFTGDGERVAALSAFTGRGDLRGYTRVAAARAIARRVQRAGREQDLDADALELLDPAIDPEVAVLRDQYREPVEAAFIAALCELAPRERAVLRFHLVDGWTIDQLAARYSTHRSTSARWLANAREKLRRGIRARLAAQLLVPESQVDSIVALVTSRIEVSLERLLS